MKIQLPAKFEYQSGLREAAYVKDGILYMPAVAFERIMYALTYEIKGSDRCYYCGKPLKRKQCTLDHVYPRMYGGFSIPDNLKPCCAKCNEQKSELLPRQYQVIRKMEDQKQRRAKADSYRQRNVKTRGEKGIILPKEWYEMRTDYSVITTFTSEHPTKASKRYQNLQELYELYGKICRPVIVSSNRVVLDGFLAIFLAKNIGSTAPIPFVVLENVVVIL